LVYNLVIKPLISAAGSRFPWARRPASEAQDVQVQFFPVGRAFSAVPDVATGRRVLNCLGSKNRFLRGLSEVQDAIAQTKA